MNHLKQFKNIHIGEDIYVIASGKSVDYIDESFFDNKITIGMNQVFKKIKCNYLVRKEAELIEEVIQQAHVSTIHFISKGACGSCHPNNIKRTKLVLQHVDMSNIVVYDHLQNNGPAPIQTLPQDDMLVVSHSTITSAIHLAAYMGAKNIILVGHDCGSINGECNFIGYHNKDTYKIAWNNGKDDYLQWLKSIEDNTIRLKKLLQRKYKCNIHSLNPFINFNLEGYHYEK